MTARLSHTAMRIEAEASRCPVCGGVPSVADAGDGLTIRCIRHPDVQIGRWRNNVTSEQAAVETGREVALRDAQVVAAPEIRAMTESQRVASTQLVNMLKGQGPAWLKDASANEVAVFCGVATMLGLNPLLGECYLLHGTFYVSRDGRRLRALATGECEGIGSPRMLSPDEERLYGVHEGDVARIVEVFRSGWRVPSVGCGIVRKGEIEGARKAGQRNGKYNLPLADSPEHMAAKRAEVAALKKAFPEVVPSRTLQIAEEHEYDIEVQVQERVAQLPDYTTREAEAIEATANEAPKPEPTQEAAEQLPWKQEAE